MPATIPRVLLLLALPALTATTAAADATSTIRSLMGAPQVRSDGVSRTVAPAINRATMRHVAVDRDANALMRAMVGAESWPHRPNPLHRADAHSRLPVLPPRAVPGLTPWQRCAGDNRPMTGISLYGWGSVLALRPTTCHATFSFAQRQPGTASVATPGAWTVSTFLAGFRVAEPERWFLWRGVW